MAIYQNTIAGSGFLQGPQGETGPAANTNITVYEYIATQGQTEFTGDDSNFINLSYTPTGIIVTLNGSVLNDNTDYIATNGTSIVLTQAANAGDELNIYTFPAFNVANTYSQAQTSSLLDSKLNLTGGTLTGNLSFSTGANLLVPVGNTATRPAASQGYIRYNTDLNTLESANGTAWANVGSGSASGGGVAWSSTVQNTNFIAVKNSGYLVNTATGNVTVTLPATPTVGDNITFVDYGGAFSSNGLIFYPNGNKINANTINIALTTSTASIGLVYTDANKGWVAYNGFQSSPIGNYNVEYLVVAGGGGGASGYSAGAGGAGGFLTGSTTLLAGTTYTISVGAGGAGITGGGTSWPTTDAASHGTNGTNSSISSVVTAIGGGGGAGFGGSGGGGIGRSGGSGGAGSYKNAAGSGTAGQGNPGGVGSNTLQHLGGGGGGASAAGQTAPDSGNSAGNGGAGSASSISGSTTYYAGGGGGGIYDNSPSAQPNTAGLGGAGGGGNGASDSRSAGSNATNNTGGGGGGGGGYEGPSRWTTSGTGGSGVVIIRYLGPQRASGGTITSSGGYTIHTFTSSSNFVA